MLACTNLGFFSKWQNPTPLLGTHHSQFEIEVGGGVEQLDVDLPTGKLQPDDMDVEDPISVLQCPVFMFLVGVVKGWVKLFRTQCVFKFYINNN